MPTKKGMNIKSEINPFVLLVISDLMKNEMQITEPQITDVSPILYFKYFRNRFIKIGNRKLKGIPNDK